MEKTIDQQIEESKEYLYYHIDQLCEKHNINFHVKGTAGIGKIINQHGDIVVTKQFNGFLWSKEQYFQNKEHNKMVRNGLYCKPYFGNKELYKQLNEKI